MIDPEKLEAQRRELGLMSLEAMRLEAERLELANRLRAAQVEAVRLGIRVECKRGCGRAVGKWTKTGVCSRCLRTEWIRKRRAETKSLRLVGGAR